MIRHIKTFWGCQAGWKICGKKELEPPRGGEKRLCSVGGSTGEKENLNFASWKPPAAATKGLGEG